MCTRKGEVKEKTVDCFVLHNINDESKSIERAQLLQRTGAALHPLKASSITSSINVPDDNKRTLL